MVARSTRSKNPRAETSGAAMPAPTVKMSHSTEHEVRERAYLIHKAHHGEPRSAIVDWVQAERELGANFGE